MKDTGEKLNIQDNMKQALRRNFEMEKPIKFLKETEIVEE